MHYNAFRGAKILRTPTLLEETGHELGGWELLVLKRLVFEACCVYSRHELDEEMPLTIIFS